MATYTNFQSLLNDTLGDYQDYGFTLTQKDDHTLELYFKDKLIAVFSQSGATPISIRLACKGFIDNM